MELRLYWSIIRARMWLVILLTLVALAASVIYSPRSVSSYRASLRLAVKPQAVTLDTPYGEYYHYVASEFLNDDIGKVIESGAFLSDLRTRAQQQRGREPSGYFEVKKAHRVLLIDAISSSGDDALMLATVAQQMLTEPNTQYFTGLTAQEAQVTVVDPPAITSSTPASRIGLDIAVRTALGLFLGVALCFLLDYLEDTVRRRSELEGLGLPVLGEIPPERGRAVQG